MIRTESIPAMEIKYGDVILFGNRVREVTNEPHTYLGYRVVMTKRSDDGAWGKFEFRPLTYVERICVDA